MGLSVHLSRARFQIRGDAVRLTSPGGDGGADAGVLILARDQVESYFQAGAFEPTRSSTLRLDPPPTGMDCAIAGFQSARATSELEIRRFGDRELHSVQITAPFTMIAADFLSADATHHWLYAPGTVENVETREIGQIVGGDLNGMSGGGYWSMDSRLDPSTTPATLDARFRLQGVHTGTDTGGRLRETPVSHHLRLLDVPG